MMTTDCGFHGQFGEDRMLAEIFSGQQGRTCVEVGANDGVTGSVSLHFEKQGWHCVLVEPNPDLCAQLREERKAFLFEGAASREAGTATLMLAEGERLSHAASSIEPGSEKSIIRQGYSVRNVTVRTERLDTILERASVKPGDIAFVSIDVEGHELDVLKGFSLAKWKPDILIAEDNSLFLGNQVRRHLASEGYVRFRRTGVNDWYASPYAVTTVSENPGREYLKSMVRSRALMLRRRLILRLMNVPVAGPKIGRLIRAVRSQAQ